MLEIIGAEPLLRNTVSAERHGYAPQPDYRPLTMFENSGLKFGHDVWDLVFKRI
jgi:tRNA (guanine-N7-)-methyltransferase